MSRGLGDVYKRQLLHLHRLNKDEDYFIGIFLSGAYQEPLGNLHNLFGNTNIIHIDITSSEDYKITNMIKEDSKAEILKVFDYNVDDLLERIRLKCESAINNKKITIAESKKLITQFESSLRESTYLSK